MRLKGAYDHLIRLQKEVELGEHKKCAAGLQHDILYWLQGGFLDKPKSEGGQAVEFLMKMYSLSRKQSIKLGNKLLLNRYFKNYLVFL